MRRVGFVFWNVTLWLAVMCIPEAVRADGDTTFSRAAGDAAPIFSRETGWALFIAAAAVLAVMTALFIAAHRVQQRLEQRLDRLSSTLDAREKRDA